jgi:cytochrome c peroxidase
MQARAVFRSAHGAAALVVWVLVGLLIGWPGSARAGDAADLRSRAATAITPLPKDAANEAHPMSQARVDLGRMLYYDKRLSKNQDVSCNSCHRLDNFGVDGEPTSEGHRKQRGGRNSPTVHNAALHVSQFWDGRAADVEEQAKGPVLNPIEMAMPSEAAVVAVLESIPGYAPLFAAAFPGDPKPIRYDNMAAAIGAFERGLITPAPFDRFLAGEDAALGPDARRGLSLFLDKGCVTCHNGAAIGGGLYRKLGLVKPYATKDPGREAVTGQAGDRNVFKVPSLRNVAKTGPWFHDGSIRSLDQAVSVMGRHQLGVELDGAERQAIGSFLESLTGQIDAAYVAEPKLPANGPKTPRPDPT